MESFIKYNRWNDHHAIPCPICRPELKMHKHNPPKNLNGCMLICGKDKETGNIVYGCTSCRREGMYINGVLKIGYAGIILS